MRNLLLAVCCLAAIGCGQTKNKVIPVQGKLTFANGKPLPVGTRLIFNPTEGGAGGASGVTGQDGTFTVTHANGAPGAEIGKYIVLLNAPEGGQSGFYKLVRKEYYDGGVISVVVAEGMSPLSLEVRN